MIPGLDILGCANKHFDLKMVLQVLPEGWAIGVFDNEFGFVLPKLRAMPDKLLKKVSAIRFHLWYDTTHSIAPLELVQKRSVKIEEFAKEHPNIKIYISHSCEHNENDVEKVRQRMHVIRKRAPSCVPVNNPWKGAILPHAINETHSLDTPLEGDYIASTDGTNLYDIDAVAWNRTHKNALFRFGWGYRFNLREITTDPPPPPKERTQAPSKEYVESVIRLCRPKESAPNVDFAAQPIADPLLYKTHSEDKPGEDPRQNKPLVMLPAVNQSVDVIDCKENVLGKFIRFDPPYNGLNRFYSGLPGGMNLYGYQIGRKALETSGSEFIWFKDAQGKRYGPCAAAFRTGYFRED